MATKEAAREKFIRSVTSPLATKKMATKLSTYLGMPVSETASPIKNFSDIMKTAAAELFEKMYENMKAAYK